MVYSMTNDKGILIQNVYHMLTYAFQVLKQNNYEDIASEEFEQIHDLFAAILSKGISQQLKQGLHREYIAKKESLPLLRGKLDMCGTAQNRVQHKQLLSCEFDELSVNNLYNQIIKTTVAFLLREPTVKQKRKSALRSLMLFFSEIDTVAPSAIHWNTLRYQRSNRNYEMLINICYFVLSGMLQTTEQGNYKMTAFSDEHMERLYERFVLEYFKQHHPYLDDAKSAQVKWNLDGDAENSMVQFLPVMQTDITLRYKEKTLIIDTKYYAKTMQQQYGSYSLHSNNLYQIFTYVKNMDKENSGNVSGILLYAKTQESISPDCVFSMGGNKISVKTLDLNLPFPRITAQLDQIATDYFGPYP